MDNSTIERSKKTISDCIGHRRIKDAIDELRKLARAAADSNSIDRIDSVEQSYRYMLQYAADGIADPERDKIYEDIIIKIKEITDAVINEIVARTSTKLYYSTLRAERMHPEPLGTLVERYKTADNDLQTYNGLPEPDRDTDKLISLREAEERVASAIFKKIWVTYPVLQPDVDIIREILADNSLPVTMRQMVMAAVMMNLLEHYNEKLLLALLDAYQTGEKDLSVKSLCCALIIMYKYRCMISHSKELQLRLSALSDDSQACSDVMMIFLQFIRARTTERITKKVQTELVPELMKLKPELRDKLHGLDADDDPESLAANPDWQEILDKSGITEKMMELNKMQMEGSDVFLSSFSRLKSFPFFNDISNWFVPFSMDNSVVTHVIKDTKGKLMEMVDKSGVFCDSDKYSFVLSLAGLPADRRVVMLGQFDEQSGAMEEMAKSELPAPAKVRENTVNKFVQNLYRFFNLFPRRSEFYNPFASTLNLIEVPFVGEILSDATNLKVIAEFYFHQELYADAVSLFSKICGLSSGSADLYQKMGFCYEKMKDYVKAAENYEKVDIIKPDDIWTLKHLALCRRTAGNLRGTLECYKRIEELQPENVAVANSIGNCLLALGQANDALKYYFKVDYLAGSSVKTLRPIAWCSFLDGNYAQSLEYYDKIIGLEPDYSDYVNRSHALLASGNVKDAVAGYAKAADLSDIGKVISAVDSDRKYLAEAGVDEALIYMLLDKLRYDYVL